MTDWTSLRQAAWIAIAALLLTTRVAFAADPAVSADVDGDGRGDRVTLDGAHPSVLRVWLSSINATSEIHSHAPIVHVVARDLDGDRRPELIANAGGHLRVWTRQRHAFRPFTPHQAPDADLGRPVHRTVDDGPVGERVAIQWVGSPVLSLAPATRPRAPDAIRVRTAPSIPLRVSTAASISSFAPRPPPSFA